jgi:hypothetical protein
MLQCSFTKILIATFLFTITLSQIVHTQEKVSQLASVVTPKYVDLSSNVQTLEVKYGIPTVGEYTIETLGYSEIRFFVSVFADNYKTTPIKDAKLNMRFFNNIQGGSWDYADYSIKSIVTSYIQGWTIQKVFGKSTRILVWAENMPLGPYTIDVTYYLIP